MSDASQSGHRDRISTPEARSNIYEPAHSAETGRNWCRSNRRVERLYRGNARGIGDEAPFLDVDEEALDLPVTQRADVVEEGVLRAADTGIEPLEDFEAYLEAQEIPVEDLREEEKVIAEKLDIEREDVELIEEEPHGEGAVLALEYVQPDRIETGALYGIGSIAGGYAALVEAGYDAELLEATVLDSDLEPFGSFHMLTAWAVEYNDGLASARTYGSKPWITSASE